MELFSAVNLPIKWLCEYSFAELFSAEYAHINNVIYVVN